MVNGKLHNPFLLAQRRQFVKSSAEFVANHELNLSNSAISLAIPIQERRASVHTFS